MLNDLNTFDTKVVSTIPWLAALCVQFHRGCGYFLLFLLRTLSHRELLEGTSDIFVELFRPADSSYLTTSLFGLCPNILSACNQIKIYCLCGKFSSSSSLYIFFSDNFEKNFWKGRLWIFIFLNQFISNFCREWFNKILFIWTLIFWELFSQN